MHPSALFLAVSLVPSAGTAPTQASAAEHRHRVDQAGDQAMGFSHEKTTHHFRLRENGGAIEVEANSGGDTESRDQIQSHLGHIAQMFAEGNFNTPMLVHGVTPPGTEAMARLKTKIRYAYEASPKGGRVVIVTSDKEALAAVHEFLRFQIKDHATGDPLTVSPKKP